MLDSIRNNKKILHIILLVFIVPSFAFFGISSYSDFFDKDIDLIKVNGKAITSLEVDNNAKRQAERFGGNSQITQSLPFRQAVLDELVQQRLLAFAVNDLKLNVSNAFLSQNLAQIPEIKALYNADGTFDATRYRQVLANVGMSVDQFENSQRFDIMVQQLVTSVARTELPNKKLSDIISVMYETERQVQALRFTASDYVSKVAPTEAQLQEYYQANTKLFEAPETIDVEFLVLKADPKEDAKAFNEKADQFANITYDQADSLKPAADKLKLSIQSAKGVGRSGQASLGKDHPMNDRRVVQALFNEEALKNKRNIEAVQISPGIFVSARVSNFYPAKVLPFKEVSAEVKRQFSVKAAQKIAAEAAGTRFEALQKNPNDTNGFAKAVWVSRNKPTDLLAPQLDAIMAVDPVKLPVVVSSTNSDGGITLYRVDQVRQPPASDAKVRAAQAQQIEELAAQAEFAAFLNHMRILANVKVVNPLKPAGTSNN
jgi:hypothetical protein